MRVHILADTRLECLRKAACEPLAQLARILVGSRRAVAVMVQAGRVVAARHTAGGTTCSWHSSQCSSIDLSDERV